MELIIRRMQETEEIPYPLLLLADEHKEAIEQYISGSEVYVGEKNHEIIAIYVLKILNIEMAEIKNIAVVENFQGRGIGTALLNHAAEDAARRGFTSLLIGTADVAIKQLTLYKKLGFEEYKIIKNFFIDNYPFPIFEQGKQLMDMVVLRKNF